MFTVNMSYATGGTKLANRVFDSEVDAFNFGHRQLYGKKWQGVFRAFAIIGEKGQVISSHTKML